MAVAQRAITISSDTMKSMDYTTTYTPATPPFWKTHQIVSGGPGKGKAVVPLLTPGEKKELRESLGSSAGPSIRRKMDPPPINGPLGQFEDDREEKTDMEKLMCITSILRNKNRVLEEMVSKLRMAHLDIEDKFCHLRISNNAKLKRIVKAIGWEDLLEPPSP